MLKHEIGRIIKSISGIGILQVNDFRAWSLISFVGWPAVESSNISQYTIKENTIKEKYWC